jgi:hypothetical protein
MSCIHGANSSLGCSHCLHVSNAAGVT